MAWYTTDFPTLTDIGLSIEDAFEGGNLIAAPDGGLQIRLKFIGFHRNSVVEALFLISVLCYQLLDGLHTGTGGESVLRGVHAVVHQAVHT